MGALGNREKLSPFAKNFIDLSVSDVLQKKYILIRHDDLLCAIEHLWSGKKYPFLKPFTGCSGSILHFCKLEIQPIF